MNINEEILHLIIRIITIALPVSLFITFAYFIIRTFILMATRDRLKKKVIAKGHVLSARLIKSTVTRGADGPYSDTQNYLDVGIYEYEYKGRKYRTKLSDENKSWPLEMELYYVKNPKKATSLNSIGSTEMGIRKCFFICFFILSAIQVLYSVALLFATHVL